MNLKDDVYSFGFILLEALVAPSVSTRKGPYILKEMVGQKLSDYCFIYIIHSRLLNYKNTLKFAICFLILSQRYNITLVLS